MDSYLSALRSDLLVLTCAATRIPNLLQCVGYDFVVPTPENAALSYRDAKFSDISATVALIESAYRGEASRAGWTTEADLLEGQRTDAEELAQIIAAGNSRIRLAFSGDQLVGCVRVEDHTHSGYIGMVTVAPTLQRAGIGRALLVEAERIIRLEMSLDRARMTVIGQRASLIDWYSRRGYRKSGVREEFPYGRERSGLPLRDDLYFEVLEKRLD